MDEIQTPEVTPEAVPLPPVPEDVPAVVPPVETVAEMVCLQPEGQSIPLTLLHVGGDTLMVLFIIRALWLRKK
jgi:hypothetical protein